MNLLGLAQHGLNNFEQIAIIGVVITAFISLIYAWLLRGKVLSIDKGTPKMQEVWNAIRIGSDSYLNRQLKTILPNILLLTVALFLSVYIVPPTLEAREWYCIFSKGVDAQNEAILKACAERLLADEESNQQILLIFGDSNTLAQYENIERIISFDSEITINEDASMLVTEQIKVYAAGQQIQRGIYRDFPTKYKDEYGNNVNIKFDVLEVSRDGNSEDYHTESLSNGIRVYCGRSDFYLPAGEYTYSIKYKTDRQIGYFEKFDELYWNLTGNGWHFLIESVTATINLPAPVSSDDLRLYGYTGPSGFKGSDYNYEVISSDRVVFTTTYMLNPKEGLTISIQWPKGLVYATR